jgi:hypothetical protein
VSLWEGIQVVDFLASVVLLVLGYRNRNRNLLLASWLCLLVAATSVADFISGFSSTAR